VNYRGESRQFQSPEVETNEGNLTIGVDDVGILAIDASAGDLNWTELDRVAVTLKYEDDGVEPIEEQFQLTQAATEYKFTRVIFQPMRKKYRYRVKYFMKGGKEYQGAELEGRSQKLFINDVFDARKTISLRGVGDFANRIQTVFVDLTYADQANSYTLQKSQALTAASPFFEWTFPVISATGGKVTYKATVAYKDGTSEDIPPTEATSDTILLPPTVQAFLEVQVVTDLIDWTQVRLARSSLRYADTENNIAQSRDFIFSPSSKANATWKVELKNRQQDAFTYQNAYYLTDGTSKQVPGPGQPPAQTHDRVLILDPKAVA